MSIADATKSHGDAVARLRLDFARWAVSPQFIDELFDRHMRVSFAPGAIVFPEGSAADVLGCVLSGFVKIYCAVDDGSRTLMRVAGPGEIIGYADSVDEKGRRSRLFEAQSLNKSTIGLITRDHAGRVLKQMDSETLVAFLESLNTFWSSNTRWFATLLGLPFQRRLEIVLEDLAARSGVMDNQGTVLIPELCHEDLAEMIGCSRPMVSRLVRDMTEAGSIVRRGRQYVLVQRNEGDTESGAGSASVASRAGRVLEVVSRAKALASGNGKTVPQPAVYKTMRQ